MDPVYVVVKRRSTRYCAFSLGQAQDVDIWPNGAAFFRLPYFIGQLDGRARPSFARSRSTGPAAPWRSLGLLGEVLRDVEVPDFQRILGLLDQSASRCCTGSLRSSLSRGSRSTSASCFARSIVVAHLARGLGRLRRARRSQLRQRGSGRRGGRLLDRRRARASVRAWRSRARAARCARGAAAAASARRRQVRRPGSGGGGSGGGAARSPAAAPAAPRASADPARASPAPRRTRSRSGHRQQQHHDPSLVIGASSSRDAGQIAARSATAHVRVSRLRKDQPEPVPCPGVDCTSTSPSCSWTIR